MPVEALGFADIIIHWIERRQMYAGTASRQGTDCISARIPCVGVLCRQLHIEDNVPSPALSCASSVGQPALARDVLPTALMRLAAAGQCYERYSDRKNQKEF